MAREFSYGDYTIRYELERKNVKNINLRMKSDGILYISANRNVPQSNIEDILRRNIRKYHEWSERALRGRQEIAAAAEIADGTSFFYLGRRLTVRFGEECGGSSLRGNELLISGKTYEERILFFRNWLEENGKPVFERMNLRARRSFEDCGYELPEFSVKLRKMRSRWGSCNASGRKISMNLLLLNFPEECIYAVFCHEYAHYFRQDHSKKFYELLLEVCPEYREYIEPLKSGAFSR